MIDGSLSPFNLPEDRRYGMFIHIVARHQKTFRANGEFESHSVLMGVGWTEWDLCGVEFRGGPL